jgi:hypothetical protein
MLWVSHLWGGVTSFLTTAASLVAALAVAKALLEWWRRGPGRRRRWWSLFSRVALQVRADYVIELFGEPTYRQCREGRRFKFYNDANKINYEVVTFIERVWLLANDGYLQVLSDETDNVVRYSLTSRNRKFHPRIPIGNVSGNRPEFLVRLGRTLFSEIPPEPRRVYRGPHGATAPYEYRQSYYFGRPGGYADWTCSYNAAGSAPVTPLPYTVPVPPWEGDLPGRGWIASLNDEQRNELNLSREHTVVNTFTIEHSQSDRSGKISYGPDRELVRLMPVRSIWWQIPFITRKAYKVSRLAASQGIHGNTRLLH